MPEHVKESIYSYIHVHTYIHAYLDYFGAARERQLLGAEELVGSFVGCVQAGSHAATQPTYKTKQTNRSKYMLTITNTIPNYIITIHHTHIHTHTFIN